jgi:hypothetical protein
VPLVDALRVCGAVDVDVAGEEAHAVCELVDDAHEVAVMSGLAAAVDLGAQYPEDLERDGFALLCFRLYYLLVYGRWYRRRAAKEGSGKNWASGVYGSVYRGPGVAETERMMWREELNREI